MPETYRFDLVTRFPHRRDNAAVAVRRLEAGDTIALGTTRIPIAQPVPEGHRLPLRPLRAGDLLLSWGLPFGRTLRDIAPGEWLCNAGVLNAFARRGSPFPLPSQPNFENYRQPYRFDPASFRPGDQILRVVEPLQFKGHVRAGGRGVGTRNYIVVLGTSSTTGGVARAVAEQFRGLDATHPGLDGVVAIAHTEGGTGKRPNNLDFLLRAIGGFMTHPNVGAVLAIDQPGDYLNNRLIQEFARASGRPLDAVPYRSLSLDRGVDATLAAATGIVREWLAPVAASERVLSPLTHLRVALQCGGSDAFSGISANPIAGWIAQEVIKHGGSANIAETDELIGAEPYMLANVRDADTARAFLGALDRFQTWAGWHGTSAEGNPSDGNLIRGLYNITVKSIGAARKKDPDLRLDAVIEYAAPMTEPGFYFMDSPGNDLESIAGQVAAGCNLILFTTGNGSITNFPFVPTIKIMTTTARFQLLERDMDINGGRYLDGAPMEVLGRNGFHYSVRVASGESTVGERAGHSQVQLWRDWEQTDPSQLERLRHRPDPHSPPLPAAPPEAGDVERIAQQPLHLLEGPSGPVFDRVALIVPTSLCAGQVGQLIARELTQEKRLPQGFRRCLALPHTEGCAVGGGDAEAIQLRTLCGALLHPSVVAGLLLEHGCERTHNHAFRAWLKEQAIDPDRFGYASIQLDGGIESVTRKVAAWFGQQAATPTGRSPAQPGRLRLGLLVVHPGQPRTLRVFSRLARVLLALGGTVVLASTTEDPDPWRSFVGPASALRPNLTFADRVAASGLHWMDYMSRQPIEALTALASTGVDLILVSSSAGAVPGHPLIPVLQVAEPGAATDGEESRSGSAPVSGQEDADVFLDPDWTDDEALEACWSAIVAVAQGTHRPRAWQTGNVAFQLSRGHLGVSL